MFDGGHIARLVVLGSHDASLVFVFPGLAEVNLRPVSVSQPAPEGVEDGGPGADVPLLDHRGVDVDILMASHELPHLASKQTFNSDNIERIMEN